MDVDTVVPVDVVIMSEADDSIMRMKQQRHGYGDVLSIDLKRRDVNDW